MAQVNFKKLGQANGDDAFTRAAESIQRRGQTVQLDIHLYLVGVATSWAASGDIRPAVKRVNILLDHLPKGVRSNALKAWVEVHFGFVWGEAAGHFVAGKVTCKDLVLKTIANVRWFDFKPEPPYKPMDFTASVMTLVKRADERMQKHDPRDSIQTDVLRAVKFAAAGKAISVDQIVEAIRALEPTAIMEVLAALQPAELPIAA